MSDFRMLVTPQELLARLQDTAPQDRDLLVVDCRGRNEYLRGHIPGAVSLPANDLQDPQSERGALRSGGELIARLHTAGIPAEGPLVIYDDTGLVPSARLFWVLELLGRSGMQLLDGGLIAWNAAGLPLQEGEPAAAGEPAQTGAGGAPGAGSDTAQGFASGTGDSDVLPAALASQGDVYAALERDDVVLVDARTPAEFDGSMETAARNGHIPGAVHINWESHIRDLFDPRFRPAAELRGLYEQQGVTPDKQVIVYCRSGSRSTHSYFTLRMLGYPRVSNYAGSWLEWGNDPATPVATGN